MAKRKRTLAQELEALSSTAPTTFDPESADAYGDGTSALLPRYDGGSASDSDAGAGGGAAARRSTLRGAADMDAMGEEYRARKVTRKTLAAQSSGESSDDGDASSSSSGSAGQDEQPPPAPSGSDTNDELSSDGEAPDFYDSDAEGEDEDAAAEQHASVFASGPEAAAALEAQLLRLAAEDTAAALARAHAGGAERVRAAEALRQRRWWEAHLEVRILLQKLLDGANRAPPPAALPLYAAADPGLAAALRKAAASADALTRSLSALRKGHMRQAFAGANGGDGGVEDLRPGSSAEEVWEDARADGRACRQWWERCVGRWQRRTAAVSPALQKKFKAVNQGVWAQVEASMADKERAKRKLFAPSADTATSAFGRFLAPPPDEQPDTAADPHDSDDNSTTTPAAETARAARWRAAPVDQEVLDDRELYHQLLRHFMENAEGAAGLDAAAAAEAAAARAKARRRRGGAGVDRRASKGRKLKYEVHAKLQNFTFPQEYVAPPMDADELFASLFGRAPGRGGGSA